MAASNDLIVSRGRSHRERVGLERSGSTVWRGQTKWPSHAVKGDLPMGLPWASECWNERRDWRVGFSSAAATRHRQQGIPTPSGTTLHSGRREHTGLGFVHGGVGIRLGGGIVVSLAALAVANFALVFAGPALCGRQLVAAIAAETEMRARARALRLRTGLCCHGGRHVPSFPGLEGGYCGAGG